MVTAFAEGLASQDVLATAKHFPGIGRVARNTDRFVETVREPAEALDRDLAPFKAAIAAGDPDHHAVQRDVPGVRPRQRRRLVAGDRDRPAARPAGVHRRLDHGLAQRDGEVAGRHAGSLAVAAANAGTDMIMITGTEASTAAVVRRARRSSREQAALDPAALEASYQRILDLKATLGG